MRIIKFRAWDKNIKEWCYFDDDENKRGISGDLKSISTQNNVGVLDNNSEYNPDLIWTQFTGLLDKNGKEIYEGDIIIVDVNDKPMVITWGERQATFCIEREGWAFRHYFGEALESKDCIIIGNIYENKELLTL